MDIMEKQKQLTEGFSAKIAKRFEELKQRGEVFISIDEFSDILEEELGILCHSHNDRTRGWILDKCMNINEVEEKDE